MASSAVSAAAASLEAPTFSSSRIVRWADCTDLEREQFAKFFAEHNVSFFRDADGSFAANIRLYDKDVLDPHGGAGAAAASAKRASTPGRAARARARARLRARASAAAQRAHPARRKRERGGRALPRAARARNPAPGNGLPRKRRDAQRNLTPNLSTAQTTKPLCSPAGGEARGRRGARGRRRRRDALRLQRLLALLLADWAARGDAAEGPHEG